VGAIQLILSGVSGDSEANSNAKDRMKGAIYGLVLTLVSFLVLKTINKDLVGPQLDPVGENMAGVFLTDSQKYLTCPKEWPDSSAIQTGFNTIRYCCDADCSGGKGDEPKVLVWQYPQKNFGGLETARVTELSCGQDASPGASFRWDFKQAGVYYCLGGCTGSTCTGMSQVNLASSDSIQGGFAGKIKNVVLSPIQTTTGETIHYGVIFHKETNLSHAGTCTPPMTSYNGVCQPVTPANTFAVDIFQVARDPLSSGNGVKFFSAPHGWDAGQVAGWYDILPNKITSNPIYSVDPNTMTYLWDGTAIEDGYAEYCKTVKKCPYSIQLNGFYLVALYTNKDNTCQTFDLDVPNLLAQPIVASRNGKINSIKIIPRARYQR
jgi:hypothetical protein